MMSNICILTSVIGLNEATIKDPIYNTFNYKNYDYFAFVDVDHNTAIWKQFPIYKFSNIDYYNDRRNAKLLKILGSFIFPGYDYYIWHDPYCEIIIDPTTIISDYLNANDFAVFSHPERNCVYDEIRICKEYSNDSNENFEQIKRFLLAEQYPNCNGLFELTSFIYKNTHMTRQFMLSWWELICKYTSRDQIIFPYLLNKYKMKYSIMPGAGLAYGGNNNIIPQIRSKYS